MKTQKKEEPGRGASVSECVCGGGGRGGVCVYVYVCVLRGLCRVRICDWINSGEKLIFYETENTEKWTELQIDRDISGILVSC